MKNIKAPTPAQMHALAQNMDALLAPEYVRIENGMTVMFDEDGDKNHEFGPGVTRVLASLSNNDLTLVMIEMLSMRDTAARRGVGQHQGSGAQEEVGTVGAGNAEAQLYRSKLSVL